MKNKEYLTVNELSQILGISRQAVIKKIKKGQIEAERIGKIYVIQKENLGGALAGDLTDKLKEEIKRGVKKVISDYGEVLKKLGNE